MTKDRSRSSLVLLILPLVFAVVTLQAEPDQVHVRLATTTSTDNSGLLTHILPRFEAVNASGLRWRVPGCADLRRCCSTNPRQTWTVNRGCAPSNSCSA